MGPMGCPYLNHWDGDEEGEVLIKMQILGPKSLMSDSVEGNLGNLYFKQDS